MAPNFYDSSGTFLESAERSRNCIQKNLVYIQNVAWDLRKLKGPGTSTDFWLLTDLSNSWLTDHMKVQRAPTQNQKLT